MAAVEVEVIVPWRGGCPHREDALQWVMRRWAEHHPAWLVLLGVDVGRVPSPQAAGAEELSPWCKAEAMAAAPASAPIVVVADADVWCSGVLDAVEAVRKGAPWAVPHDRVHRLSENGTSEVLAGAPPFQVALEQRPYRGHIGGGMVVLPLETLKAVPIDRRFRGWGQEDDSWAVALSTLAGVPWRGRAPLWHLWHPPQARQSRQIGSDEGQQLFHRYLQARRHPDRMRALIAEAG